MKLRALCILSVFALALGSGLGAQTNNPGDQAAAQPQTMTSTATGTVVSSDGGSLVIDTGNGRQTFIVDGSSTLPANLTPGNRVSVQYHTLSGNRLHAASASLLSTDTAPARAETAPPAENPPTTSATGTTPMGSTDTIEGTVISSTPAALVVRTPSGQRRFVVDTASTVPGDLTRGATVTVEYHTLPGNRFHAATVTMLSPAPTAAADQTTTTTGTEGQRTASNLPATGSEMPLVALIGLLSLVAAFGVRAMTRRSA